MSVDALQNAAIIILGVSGILNAIRFMKLQDRVNRLERGANR